MAVALGDRSTQNRDLKSITRPNISESHSEISTRVPFCIATGWQRDPVSGALRANPATWPHGYKALIDYLHERKLKICAYSDTGAKNCCGEPGEFHDHG